MKTQIAPNSQNPLVVSQPLSAAQARYNQMCRENMEPVISLLLRERDFVSAEEAHVAVKAMLQWLAGHAVKKKGQLHVMLHGPVDKAWHAFLLNTKLYHKFCAEQVGFFVHHTPLDTAHANEFEILGGITTTINFLIQSFGDSLNPLLVQWKELNDSKRIKISAVSCVGNGYGD